MRSSFLRRARVALLLGLILPGPAIAQSLIGGTVLNGNVPAYNVNGTAPLTIDQATLGLRVTCVSGCAGGSGGSGTANPYPGSDYATAGRQDAGNAGIGAPGDAIYAGTGNAGLVGLNKGQYAILANLYATYGTTADAAAAATGANGTDIALLKALRDKLNGSIAVTGTFWQATQPISAASLPLPGGASTAANQATEIAALGAPADAANANTIIGQLKQLNVGATPAGGNIIGRVGIDQTTQGTTNGVVVNSSALPAGGATATNQANEIAQLTAANQRAAYVLESNGAIASSGSVSGTTRDAGASPSANTKFVASAYATVAGTLFVQLSPDGATWYNFQSVAVSAGSSATLTQPIVLRYSRLFYANGTTAGTLVAGSSLLTN